jgi:hypothetical protein
MTNPQLTKNLLAVIRSLPDENRRWLLEQLGWEAGDLSSQDLAELTRPCPWLSWLDRPILLSGLAGHLALVPKLDQFPTRSGVIRSWLSAAHG